MIQITEGMALYPQRTIIFGDTRAEDPVIDTGAELPDNLGRLYISFDEFEEMARVMGYIAPDVYEGVVLEHAALQDIVDHLDEIAEETADAVRNAAAGAVQRLLSDLAAARRGRDSAPVEDEPEGGSEPDGDDEAAGLEDDGGVRSPAKSKPGA